MANETPSPSVDPIEGWIIATTGRQRAFMEQLRDRASSAGDDLARGVGWVRVRDQTRRTLLSMSTLGVPRGFQAFRHHVDSHRSGLEGLRDEADLMLSRLDDHTRDVAARAFGIRLAVAGKGGAGKSLISGTLARLLARRGRRVLSVDLDPNPGLAYNLGLAPTDEGFPTEPVPSPDGPGATAAPRLDPTGSVERLSRAAPDGVRYLGIAKITEPEREGFLASRGALFEILQNFAEPGWDVIGDLEAGTNTPFQGFHLFADRVMVVVGPSAASALTLRRLQPLIGDMPSLVVANRWPHPDHHPGIVPLAAVPFDPAVSEADRLGVPLIDHRPGSPAMVAMEGIARMLVNEEAPA